MALRGRATRGHRGATPPPLPAPAQPRPAASGGRKSCAESHGAPDPRAGGSRGGGGYATHAGQVCGCVPPPVRCPAGAASAGLRGCGGHSAQGRLHRAAPRERTQVRRTVRLRARGGSAEPLGPIPPASPHRATPSGESEADGECGPGRARRLGLEKAQRLAVLPGGAERSGGAGRSGAGGGGIDRG